MIEHLAAMIDFFQYGKAGAIIGTSMGLLGALCGCLSGAFAQKGKHRGLVLGVYYISLALSIALLIAGVVTLAGGQPYAVYYSLLYPGIIGTLLFGILLFTIRNVYMKAEEHKAAAAEL